MGENTKIQWATDTFNVVWGCQKVSPACKNCYAENLSTRFGKTVWGPNAPRQEMSGAYWKMPTKWDRQAESNGERRRVFCSSMADVFEDHPTVEKARQRLWPVISKTPNLDWLLLTKRPQNIPLMVPIEWNHRVPSNVWIGTTVEDQEWADRRVDCLLAATGARVRFLSVEPLLGPITLPHLGLLDWVIIGGESGPHSRPMEPEWVVDILDQCARAGVPVFFKQTGEVLARRLGLKDKKGGDITELPLTFQRRELPFIAQ